MTAKVVANRMPAHSSAGSPVQPRPGCLQRLVESHRSTTPFLTCHMLKEFSSASEELRPPTPRTFQITNTYIAGLGPLSPLWATQIP